MLIRVRETNMGLMLEKIGLPAMHEQLAEEATELAKEALKMARILRGENPTPVTMETAMANLREEYTDVVQCAEELGIMVDKDQIERKQARFRRRWIDRMEEMNPDGKPGETNDLPQPEGDSGRREPDAAEDQI